jgi:hypothetical protein
MGLRKLPLVFTEQGVAMLSSVLNSDRAINVNIQIIRTFTKIRELLATNEALQRKVMEMERKYDGKIKEIFDTLGFLLEDKINYDQRNYTNYFNGENPIVNFEHNHELRSAITNILGDAVSGTTNGNIVTKNFSIPIPANITNPANISFAAFLVGSDNVSLNARAALANENQTFEQNP